MRGTCLILLALACCIASPLDAGESLHPVKMSAAQIAGQLFEDHDPVMETGDGHTTWDVEAYLSPQRDFDMGMWRSEAFRKTFTDPWPYNEYIHITEGSLTITSADGLVTELAIGDSAVIPMGWTGTWDTPGLTKIYVIHAPNGDL